MGDGFPRNGAFTPLALRSISSASIAAPRADVYSNIHDQNPLSLHWQLLPQPNGQGLCPRAKIQSICSLLSGIETHGLNPNAVQVMAEVGIDISAQQSTQVDQFRHIDFDWVVTVCDHAAEQCPVFPGRARVVHRAFDDPPKLARDARSEEEALGAYRRVRDEIGAYIETLPEGLAG